MQHTRRVWGWILMAATAMLLLAVGPLAAQTAAATTAPTTMTAAAASAPAPAAGQPSLSEAFGFIKTLHLDVLLTLNRPINWFVLLAAIFLGLFLGRIASWILRSVGDRLEKRGWVAQGQAFSSGAGPASLAIFTIFFSVGLLQLHSAPLPTAAVPHPDNPIHDLVGKVIVLLYVVAIFWYLFNLVDIVEHYLKVLTRHTKTSLDDMLVPIIRKTLRIFLVVVGALVVLNNVFGFDIGAWLAGLGIAGLAVSLAAQDSLKNLFGSITILLDRPYLVGHRIKFKSFDGIVEEIGFRSTKLRDFEGHLITIPNSITVNESIENVSARGFLRRIMNVTITYDTPPEKIKQAVQILKDMLENDEFAGPVHALGSDYAPRVYFSDLNADNLNIQVTYWYFPIDWWAYMAYNEKFNQKLLELFAKADIDLAFPTQTLYLAGDQRRPLSVTTRNEHPPTNQQQPAAP